MENQDKERKLYEIHKLNKRIDLFSSRGMPQGEVGISFLCVVVIFISIAFVIDDFVAAFVYLACGLILITLIWSFCGSPQACRKRTEKLLRLLSDYPVTDHAAYAALQQRYKDSGYSHHDVEAWIRAESAALEAANPSKLSMVEETFLNRVVKDDAK